MADDRPEPILFYDLPSFELLAYEEYSGKAAKEVEGLLD